MKPIGTWALIVERNEGSGESPAARHRSDGALTARYREFDEGGWITALLSGEISRSDGRSVRSLASLPIGAGAGQGGHQPIHALDTISALSILVSLAIVAAVIAVVAHRRGRRVQPVTDHWATLAVMGELCPYGWQAQISLYGWGAPVPDDAPPARTPLVALDWKQFDDEFGRVVVQRRVWARTIEEALQKMIDDRRLDVSLEQIGQDSAIDELR